MVIPASSLCHKGAGAVEGGVDAPPHLHRGNIQHHRRARHGGVERDPPQNRDDVQLVGTRLPRPQLFGQCSVRAGLSGRDGGLPQTCRRRRQLGHSTSGLLWKRKVPAHKTGFLLFQTWRLWFLFSLFPIKPHLYPLVRFPRGWQLRLGG